MKNNRQYAFIYELNGYEEIEFYSDLALAIYRMLEMGEGQLFVTDGNYTLERDITKLAWHYAINQ